MVLWKKYFKKWSSSEMSLFTNTLGHLSVRPPVFENIGKIFKASCRWRTSCSKFSVNHFFNLRIVIGGSSVVIDITYWTGETYCQWKISYYNFENIGTIFLFDYGPDLLPRNFRKDVSRFWILKWEYAECIHIELKNPSVREPKVSCYVYLVLHTFRR